MRDNLIQKENTKWTFDSDVTNCFDDMLSRSIPQYDVMRKCVVDLSRIYLKDKEKFDCLDVGCSNGLMIKNMIDNIDAKGIKGNYTGIDVSEPMLAKARELFKSNHNVYIRNCDLRTDYPNGSYDIITCILSLMFTPIEYRQNIVQNMYDSLNHGGCLFLVEKVLGNSSQISDMFIENYYDMKRENGYSQEQIDRKRLSLEGVQVCVTSDWNIELLKQAGFRKVDVFWRWCNFMGVIAIK